MALKFRVGRTEPDYEVAASLFERTVHDETAADTIARLPEVIHDSEGKLVLTFDDDQPVGAALVLRNLQDVTGLASQGFPDHARWLYETAPMLELIGVLPAYRGAGVGRQLVDGAAMQARHRLGGYVMHVVMEADSPQLAFFSKCGFKLLPTGEPIYVPSPHPGGESVGIPLAETHQHGILQLV